MKSLIKFEKEFGAYKREKSCLIVCLIDFKSLWRTDIRLAAVSTTPSNIRGVAMDVNPSILFPHFIAKRFFIHFFYLRKIVI